MSPIIWLIAEDRTDFEVFKAKKITIEVKYAGDDQGGISRLAQQLERFILTILDEKADDDCIVVLHDADELTQPDRKHYRAIEQVCNQYDEVVHIVAKDEIESWLLADTGLCEWLSKIRKGKNKVKAKNCDGEKQPSRGLDSLLREAGMKWQGERDRDKVLEHLDGTGERFSGSMQEAVANLKDCLPPTEN